MTERYYPWNVLEIDETDNKKTIKKAYAALIKQYKPDEHPEKFKEIQTAYQAALAVREWQVEDTLDVKLQETNIENRPQSDDFILENAPPLDEETIDEQRQQNQLIENLYQQLYEMAFAPLAIKNKLDNWKFIEDYYQIDDIVLKSDVAMKVFAKMAEYNLFQLKSNGTLLISEKIIHYFNQVFDWNSQWESYQSAFDNDYYRINFQFLDEQEDKKAKPKSLLYLRFKSLFADLLLVFIIGFVTLGVQAALGIVLFEKNIFAEVYFSALILLKLAFEIKSKNKRTPGKTSNNLIIVDEFGNYCSVKQTLIRHFVLSLQLLLIFVIPLFFNSNVNEISLICFYAFIFSNIILYVLSRKMVHDYFSNTTIVRQLLNH